MIKRWILLILCVTFAGCSAELSDYETDEPKFNLFEYFEGNVSAWGMIQGYSGKQTRRFSVQLSGTVDGDKLTLIEDFIFDDGEESQRIWEIDRLKDGRYQGQADDIVGIAHGMESGNALQWRYDFDIKMDGTTYRVAFDDWLYRQDDAHVFNLTSIKKFGIEVGTITLFFQKL